MNAYCHYKSKIILKNDKKFIYKNIIKKIKISGKKLNNFT